MLIKNNMLQGRVRIPPSKSVSHRAIICAALAQGTSVISNLILSEDTLATINCLRLLGADISCVPEQDDRYQVVVKGGLQDAINLPQDLDCGESGSTLRFLIPIAAALGAQCSFVGQGRLAQRPLDSYYEIFDKQSFGYTVDAAGLPLTLAGRLQAGQFVMRGDISSQFITGLLFALPLLEGDSRIVVTTELESVGYIDLTLQVLREFGVVVDNLGYKEFVIKGSQSYTARSYTVEGDYSQAAFWLVASCLGNDVVCCGLNPDSLQADKAILNILEDMGGEVVWLDKTSVTCAVSPTYGRRVDVSNCPDLGPILTLLAALSSGQTQIVNAARLRIKESDRITSIATELNKLGAKIVEQEDSLVVEGVRDFKAGVALDAWNDHRIAMTLGIACTSSKGDCTLSGHESVKKSYPAFWADFQALGGVCKE